MKNNLEGGIAIMILLCVKNNACILQKNYKGTNLHVYFITVITSERKLECVKNIHVQG